MRWRARRRRSRGWLAGALAALALAGAIALAAGCDADVPLGVNPHSDAAQPPADAADAGS